MLLANAVGLFFGLNVNWLWSSVLSLTPVLRQLYDMFGHLLSRMKRIGSMHWNSRQNLTKLSETPGESLREYDVQ